MDGLKKLWVLHLFFSESSFGKNAFHNSTYIASLVMYSGTCIELRIFSFTRAIFFLFVEFISYVLDFFDHLSNLTFPKWDEVYAWWNDRVRCHISEEWSDRSKKYEKNMTNAMYIITTPSLPPELAIAFVSKLLPASKSKSERILSENDYDKLCSLDWRLHPKGFEESCHWYSIQI